jgi:hypothetical protein
MANQLSAIFQGVPPKESRDTLGEFVRQNLSRYSDFIVPCTGRFAAAEVMVGAGVPPDKIKTSDISLFTSALGYYYMDKPLDDLGAAIHAPEIKFLEQYFDGKLDHAAAVLLAQKYLQTSDKNHYMRAVKKELLKNWQTYFDHLKAQIEEHKKLLKGIDYEIADVWDVLDQWKGNKQALIYINPPAYKGGYTRMFKTEAKLTWNEPNISEFDPKKYKEMLETLTDADATAIVYRYQTIKEVPDNWIEIYARNYSGERTDYLVCNKSSDIKCLFRKRDTLKKSRYPIFTDEDEITKWTKVSIVPVDRDVAAYYRDLFIHRLGASSADATFLMLLNGKIFTVFGISLRQVFQGMGYIHETFGISAPSKRYPRLNRLFMKLLTCKDFKRDLEAHINFGVSEWNGLKTACLARLPEVRINNGILKIVAREKMKNGLWKIDYYTDLWNKTYKMCIIEWLDENAKRKRERERMKKNEQTKEEKG